MKFKEITSTSGLGIGHTAGRMSRTKWKDYLRRAVVLLKNNKQTPTNSKIIVLAAVLKKRDER